ncbi:hypothetical protein V6N11_070786 [Hibiscus sabdariffa]|uniref:C-JID domain-containing protein n=1 Tax=Hibiscus sabdariffa TaxID=183260 RepID=A0ABR2QG15_9ROSI
MLEIRSRLRMKNAEELATYSYMGTLDDGLSKFLDKGTDSTEGMKLDMFEIDKLQLRPTVFEKMLNLRYINFYFSSFSGKSRNQKLHADDVDVDDVFLPEELRLLCWEHYPFKSLSSFNPKNLVVLKLPHGDMEQLWTDDDHWDLNNLRKVVLSDCKKSTKIPNLLSATNLEIVCFNGCRSLVEFPCFDHLTSLKTLQLHGCCNLKKFPEVTSNVSLLNLTETGVEEVPDSIHHLGELEILCLSNSSVKNVSTNISKLESLRFLDLSHCLIAEFPEITRRSGRPRRKLVGSSLPEAYASEQGRSQYLGVGFPRTGSSALVPGSETPCGQKLDSEEEGLVSLSLPEAYGSEAPFGQKLDSEEEGLFSLSLPEAYGSEALFGQKLDFEEEGFVSLSLPEAYGSEAPFGQKLDSEKEGLVSLSLPEAYGSEAPFGQKLVSEEEGLVSLSLPEAYGSETPFGQKLDYEEEGLFSLSLPEVYGSEAPSGQKLDYKEESLCLLEAYGSEALFGQKLDYEEEGLVSLSLPEAYGSETQFGQGQKLDYEEEGFFSLSLPEVYGSEAPFGQKLDSEEEELVSFSLPEVYGSEAPFGQKLDSEEEGLVSLSLPEAYGSEALFGQKLDSEEEGLVSLSLPEAYGSKASSSQKLSSNITPFGSRGLPEVDVPSSNLWFKSLGYLKMIHCKSLKSLSELPPYLRYLNAHGCTSLENVWFTIQNRDLYEPHSFDGEDEFFMIFSNCFSLNAFSICNIEKNVMLKVISLAKNCACSPKKVICCIPGNGISAYRFEYQGMNASLILKIPSNGYSGRRFLVFVICLVADLMHCQISGDLEFICEYQLTVTGGGYEKFRSEWCYKLDYVSEPEYMGDHKLILFSGDMIKEDKDYEEASFQFYIKNRYYSGEEEDIKVKKCGVHLSYVDEEGNVLQQRNKRPRSAVDIPELHF